MATVDLVMPKMGESIMEATILKWHKQPGDAVRMDETVLEIATDKVDSEVPSTEEGVIQELLFKENDVVPVGATIARIKTDVSEAINTGSPEYNIQPQEEAEIFVQAKSAPASQPAPQPIFGGSSSNGNRFYSPLVLNIAAQEGVSLTELERLPGTGNEGRVTKKDILDYVNRRSGSKGAGSNTEIRSNDQPSSINVEENRSLSTVNNQRSTVPSGNVEII